MEDKIIYEIPISINTVLKVNIHEYINKNKELKKYFCMRFWNKTLGGKWFPKENGLNIELKYWGEFHKAFKALEKEIIDNHLEEV